MLPKIYFKLGELVRFNEKRYLKFGCYAISAFVLFIVLNVVLANQLVPITIFPLGVVFLLCGFGLIAAWYKPSEANKAETFEMFWSNISIFRKAFLWYASIFITFWFFGVFIISLASVALTIAILFS